MAGSTLSQMIELDTIGEELIRLGWRQGSVLKVPFAQKSWLALNISGEKSQPSTNIFASSDVWSLQQEALDIGDLLAIASQTCDIKKSSKLEPYVETLRVYWTYERGVIHEAGKNSVRRFVIQRRTNSEGKVEGLIADATVRIQIEKTSLLRLRPLFNFEENDKITSRRFRKWLAKRYDRPAIPDTLVVAVQKPFIKAIDKLHPMDDKHRILDGIREILFLPYNDSAPFLIDMLFIRDESSDAPTVSDEDAAKLAGCISDVLKRGGSADLAHWEILSLKKISVYDYANALELPTDQYSLGEDENAND
jgi:hypothetical protein